MNNKIFLVLPSLSGGGAEKFMVRLANAFADRGFNVSLLLFTNHSDDYLQEISTKVHLVRLRSNIEPLSIRLLNYLKPLKGLIHQARSIWLLSHYFKQQKPSIIFCTMTHANVICLLAKRLSGVKTNIFIRSANVFSEFDITKDKYSKLIAKFIYPLASGIILPSQDVYQDSIKNGINNKNMAVIYNFVDKQGLKNLATMPIDLPAQFSYPIILAVGRLSKKKNHIYLIRSFHAFCQQYDYPNAKLIILGKGPEQAHLEKVIHELNLQDKVFLKGFINNPYPYFAKADLFVHTSKVEGLANVLLAAMALECNIITTNCAGASEALSKGQYGRLIPLTDDVNVLAKEMNQALQQPISKTLLQESINNYAVDKVVNQYIAFMGMND